MAQEIEVKFRVAGLAGIRRRVRAAGGVHRWTVRQTDVYFDTPARDLLAGNTGLRLRHVRAIRRGTCEIDTRSELTYKGPPSKHKSLKIRPEHQTHIDDADAVIEILTAVGVQPAMTIQKRRASYQLGPCLVELDELPAIGCFVEIEGPSESAIAKAAALLNLTGPGIREHYIDLLTGRCKRVGTKCTNVTFDDCNSSCKHH